ARAAAGEDPPQAAEAALHDDAFGIVEIRFGKRVEPDRVHEVVDGYVEERGPRIEGRAGLVRAAAGEGVQHRATLARRREHPFVSQAAKQAAALLQTPGVRIPQVALAKLLRHESGR